MTLLLLRATERSSLCVAPAWGAPAVVSLLAAALFDAAASRAETVDRRGLAMCCSESVSHPWWIPM